MKTLPLPFYQRNTKRVAKELLGKTLVHIYKGRRLSGIITEVEAYLGGKDKACHTYGNRCTSRTQAMYLAGGHAYVYFIYGLYNCFNVVTQNEGRPEAVLIRSLEPVDGIEHMKTYRKKTDIHALTTGPGRLAQAMQITKKENGKSLVDGSLFIEDAPKISNKKIVACARIGVAYAEEDAALPLRFYIKGSKFISKK